VKSKDPPSFGVHGTNQPCKMLFDIANRHDRFLAQTGEGHKQEINRERKDKGSANGEALYAALCKHRRIKYHYNQQ
jgi:hypothetical protein